MLDTIKPLVNFLKRQTLSLNPIENNKKYHQNVETGIDDISLPSNGVKREREHHRDEQAAEFGRHGVESHSCSSDFVRQNFGWVQDGEWRDPEAVHPVVDEYHGDCGVDAGRVCAASVDGCETADKVEGDYLATER